MKKVGLTLVAITVFALPITLVFYIGGRGQSPQTPIMTIGDQDSDGVPDDIDLLVAGNAWVRVGVGDFDSETGCGNWLPPLDGKCEPKFTLAVDANLDGVWEPSAVAQPGKTNHLEFVMSGAWDIPETATRVGISLRIVDLDGNNEIDYRSASYPDGDYFVVSVRNGPQEFSMSGEGSESASVVITLSVVLG